MLFFVAVAYEFITVHIGIGAVLMDGFEAFDPGGEPCDIRMV
jgi:hypothetical protein